MPNEPFISSGSRPSSGPLLGDTTLSFFVTNLLPSLYPIIVFGPRDKPPIAVKPYKLSATVTGSKDVSGKLGVLSFGQVIGLLNQFTFQLDSDPTTYTIEGSAPSGGTFDSPLGSLSLRQIGQSLSQVTFKVNGKNSYTITVNFEQNVGDSYLDEAIGKRSLGYLTIGLKFMDYSVQQVGVVASGGPVIVTFDSNKGHTE
jgi:hypothetical protein